MERDSTPAGDATPPSFEAWLVHRSPLPAWLTIALVFALPLALYSGLVALRGGNAWSIQTADQLFVSPLWLAIVFCAIAAGAIAVTYYGWRSDLAERDRLAATLVGGHAGLKGFAGPHDAKWRRRHRMATLLGFGAGLLIAVPFIYGALTGRFVIALTFDGLWFTAMGALLIALLLRGVVDTLHGEAQLRDIIRDNLEVDLLDTERLSVYGRLGLRSAVAWLVMLAIILLFFLRPDVMGYMAVPTLLVSFATGLYALIQPVRGVRARVAQEKAAHLDQIRTRIKQAQRRLMDGDAAPDLPGLLALEARLEQVREWPLSAPTAGRFAVYVLLPVIPWFGAALAERLLQGVV